MALRFILHVFTLCLFANFLGCSTEDPLIQLRQDILEKIDGQPGTYAIAFLDLEDSTNTLLINEKEVFHAASTMKTPVMIEVFKQDLIGGLHLEDSIEVKNTFYSIVDSSTYQMEIGEDSEEKLYARIGQKATIRDLVYDMITYSSNLATNIIIDKVDARKVTQTMRDMGAMDIQVLRGVEDSKAYDLGLNNTTTAYDLMLIFKQIGTGKAVSPKASESMIEILLDQKFNEEIPALLPDDVKVAHKTGWISTASHDSGLVILPDQSKYVLVIMSKNWESSDASNQLKAEISRMIYDYYIARRAFTK